MAEMQASGGGYRPPLRSNRNERGGKVALITGGSDGIGGSVARHLIRSTANKHAGVGLVRSMGAPYAAEGIRVHAR
jgi:hypothetical protein